MVSVFNVFRSWLKRRPDHKQVAAAPLEAPWSHDDALTWKRIMDSPIGTKFVLRARAMHYSMSTSATEPGRFTAEQNAFVARGFAECLNWIFSLARVRSREEMPTMEETANMTEEQRFQALMERLQA